jgi:PiT family inorganic phosphate transporter
MLLVAVTVFMALISGINDGGVLLAFAVRYPQVRLGWFLAILSACLVIAPMILGTSVARTLVSGLFTGQNDTEIAFLVAVSVALAVVVLLSRKGVPTSMTLALVGSLSGAAAGSGVGVSWGAVGRVLVLGAAAPLIGALASSLTGRVLGVRAVTRRTPRTFQVLHVSAFTAQCLAYAVNDGQKMLAVAAVAAGGLGGSSVLLDPGGSIWLLMAVMAAITMLFCIGMLISLRVITPKFASGLAVLRPIDAVSAEVIGAAAVFGSSLAGAPVSATQTLAGAVIGTAASKGARRVRWDSASRIGVAWLVTLPATAAIAFVATLPVR